MIAWRPLMMRFRYSRVGLPVCSFNPVLYCTSSLCIPMVLSHSTFILVKLSGTVQTYIALGISRHGLIHQPDRHILGAEVFSLRLQVHKFGECIL
jgi:hypothetical protein